MGTVNTDAAVPSRAVSDEQIVAQGKLIASAPYVEIYQHGTTVEALPSRPEDGHPQTPSNAALITASYRLVKFLIEAKGVETFMKLYGAEKPADGGR